VASTHRPGPLESAPLRFHPTGAPTRDRGLNPLLERALEGVSEIPRSEIYLLERLQSGGISSCTVYKGKWKGVAVAMKVPRCEQGERAYMVLEAELGVLSQLQHPRLVSLLGVCRDLHILEGGIGLVMELIDRGSLYRMLHCNTSSAAPFGRISDGGRLRLAVDITDGMRFLHQSHVVHLNLSSLNVLVGADGRAKIADFGLSRTRQQTVNNISNAATVWSAPEVIASRCEGDAGLPADVYSFGVVLWEVFTGSIPWEGKSAFEAMTAVVQGESLAIPAALSAELPAVANIITRCCGAAVHRPSFEGLHEELCGILKQSVAAQASPDSPFPMRYICSIGYEVMVDPVVSSDGHTYERANIEQWFTLSNRSPKTNLPLRNKELFPNLALKETIEEAVLSHLFSRPGL
jgi:serine/threonine protein kinase